MKGIPGTEYIHLLKTTGHYQISRKVKGKTYSFGTYATLKEAIKARDYFESINWNITFRLHHSKSNHIVKLPSGKYSVIKQKDTGKGHNTTISYGTFNTHEEAEHQVKLCKTFQWDKRLKPFDCMKHIHKRTYPSGTVVWRIIKNINGKQEIFGAFQNLEHAKYERDLLMTVNWDVEALDSIDESQGTDQWLGKYGKNQYYTPANGRIDYDKELIPNE